MPRQVPFSSGFLPFVAAQNRTVAYSAKGLRLLP
jgi:hypothetical protein